MTSGLDSAYVLALVFKRPHRGGSGWVFALVIENVPSKPARVLVSRCRSARAALSQSVRMAS